jgi:ABC-type bacteriocin/lantibiotic exporter with double-glycine peptidase domain
MEKYARLLSSMVLAIILSIFVMPNLTVFIILAAVASIALLVWLESIKRKLDAEAQEEEDARQANIEQLRREIDDEYEWMTETGNYSPNNRPF